MTLVEIRILAIDIPLYNVFSTTHGTSTQKNSIFCWCKKHATVYSLRLHLPYLTELYQRLLNNLPPYVYYIVWSITIFQAQIILPIFLTCRLLTGSSMMIMDDWYSWIILQKSTIVFCIGASVAMKDPALRWPCENMINLTTF